MELKAYINVIKDYPHIGQNYYDMAQLLSNPDAFSYAINKIASVARDYDFDKIACIDDRGFLFAGPLAFQMHKPLFPIRRDNRHHTGVKQQPYHNDNQKMYMEMAPDSILPGDKVILIDDVLAEGISIYAACQLITQAGGEVAVCITPIELTGCKGRIQLAECPYQSLLAID